MDSHRSGLILENPFWTSLEREQLRQLVEIFPQAQHFWIASSGSSQGPENSLKLVALSEEAILNSAKSVNQFLESDSKDRWLKALPSFHVGGFAIEKRAQLSGAKIYSLPEGKWSPLDFVELLQFEKITLTSLVPSQLYDLVENQYPAPASLRAVLVGGASLSEDLYRQLIALGWPLILTYGMTETSSMVAASRDQSSEALPRLQALAHAELRLNSEKRIQVKSSSLLSGFAQWISGKPTWIDPKEQGWYTSSDLGDLSSHGFQILGRENDWVKILGEGVSVMALREKLATLLQRESLSPLLAEILVLPEARKGHELILVFENAVPEQTRNLVQRNFNAQVQGFEKIQKLVQVSKIPRSDLGKLLTEKLKSQLVGLL